MNRSFNTIRRNAAKLGAVSTLAGLGLVAISPAHAALDIAAATTSVADAQTALLAVLALIVAMTAGVWAIKKVAGLFGGK